MWKLLCVIDLVIAFVLVGQVFFDVPWRLVVAFAGHLLVKAWLFWPEPLSIADSVIAVIALVGLVMSVDPVTWAAAGVLAYKSLPAFLSL